LEGNNLKYQEDVNKHVLAQKSKSSYFYYS
jgi:hypothetical protein